MILPSKSSEQLERQACVTRPIVLGCILALISTSLLSGDVIGVALLLPATGDHSAPLSLFSIILAPLQMPPLSLPVFDDLGGNDASSLLLLVTRGSFPLKNLYLHVGGLWLRSLNPDL